MNGVDLSHVTDWPPSPSTVNGIGLVVFGMITLLVGQVELGAPAILGGITAILVPDSTAAHAESLKDLHHNVSSLRASVMAAAPKAKAASRAAKA